MPINKKTPTKKAPAKKTSAKKTSAKETSAKKTPAKKTPAKKTPAKKAPAKKTSARKVAAGKKPAATKKQTRAGESSAARKKPRAAIKPAARKPAPVRKPAPPAVPPAQPAPDAEPVPYSLSELVTLYGPATEAEVLALVDRERQELVDDGAGIATPRIDTDCARLYGKAGSFYERAEAREREALRGFGRELLRVAVWAARRGQELHEARRLAESAGASRKQRRQQEGLALRQQAVGRREQLASLLRLAAGGHKGRAAQIDDAYGRIATPEELAQALGDLARLGRDFIGVKAEAGLRNRAATAGLTAAYLGDIEALAQRVRTELKTAAASRESAPVTQAVVDLWDGINLYLVERIIDLFEVAHQLEPTVPRLLPLALRSFFGRRSAGPKAVPAPPLPGSPPTS